MISRYGSQLLRVSSLSVLAAGLVADLVGLESVNTSMAGFAARPQLPGWRTLIPAAFKYALAVSRRTPMACSMRRKDQPSPPKAITCCRLSSLNTLLMALEASLPPGSVNVPGDYFCMAGFAVFTYGEAALTSIMRARAILSAAQEPEALAAVGRARTALAAGEADAAALAVDEAQVALAAINKAEAKLDAAERADSDLGVREKVKIDLFDYASAYQDDVSEFLAADLSGAILHAARYRESVARVEIVPTKDGDKVMRRGC